MKNYLVHNLIKFLFLFFISITIHASGNESDSLLMESLDEVLIEEYKPCSDQSDISSFEVSTISSLMIVSEDSSFAEGEVVTSASGVQAIVDSYDVETQKLTYHQDANTGFETFLLNETITGTSSGIATVKEFIIDLAIPCFELIVSIEEEPQQMIFTPKESAEEAKAAAAEMMAEDIAAYQARVAEEKAAYQARAAAELVREAKAAAAEMMAEIEQELAREAALEAFQQKLAEERAAAAASTAAYQSKLAYDAMVEELMEALAIEQEIEAFEAKLAADLASDALDRELAEFEVQLKEELANQAALAKFLEKLAEERAAAVASTAAYQAKVAYDARVAKIKEDLVRQLEEVVEPDDYKSHLVEELIAQATAKLEEEKFIGAISGEIVTVAIHEFCKDTLNLSDSNITLFKKALAGGYLGNVGPQVKHGTEFTANRWDKYITCVGSLGN